MSPRHRFRSLALVPVLALIFALPAAAGGITSFGGASGPGLASMSFNNVTITGLGNDNAVGASGNAISINQKAFGSSDYIDMVFTVEDFGVPVTEYMLYEGVHNGTSDEWIGYQIRLGYGTGAGFTSVSFGDGLDFDDPDFDSPVTLPPFALGAYDFGVINGVSATVYPGQFVNFAFPIDVPNGITEFTIRQEPRVAPVNVDEKSWSEVKRLYR